MVEMDLQAPLLLCLGVSLLYGGAVLVYRLCFHPLAKFPGPPLAAASLWYEFYYDVVKQGQLIWQIEEMHREYGIITASLSRVRRGHADSVATGPIVRINPHELHINDPDYYNELYAPAAQKRDKYQWWCNLAGAPGSIFATVGHDLHRLRRAPLNNFFSKRAVADLEPLIKEKVEKLASRFQRAKGTGEVIRADCAFMAVTMDVICSYCFGVDRNYLDRDNFGQEWKETINGAWSKGAVMRQFPWMASVMRVFPRSLARRLDRDMSLLLAWQDSVRDAVEPIVNRQDTKMEYSRPTIFHALRDSDLPPEERSLQRLCDEGEIFTGAGSETTAKALATIAFYLLADRATLQLLKDELTRAMPNAAQLISWSELEQLPYLVIFSAQAYHTALTGLKTNEKFVYSPQ
jgi:hypothetical protein